jgi:membrane-associated phospholipid phosphatase
MSLTYKTTQPNILTQIKNADLLPLEWATLAYTLLTSVLIIAMFREVDRPMGLLLQRAGIVFTIFCLRSLNRRYPSRLTFFLRIFFHIALLGYWYPDTYNFNRFFVNLDPLFASADQWLFGYQPAITFSEALPQKFWSEAFCMGYFSYYFMIIGVPLYYFFRRYNQFEHSTFVVIASFYIYYLIFIAVPVAGPQCYYQPAGLNNILHGVFPNIHDYFLTHSGIAPTLHISDGFFHQLVGLAHKGECPTAAFPSSHIGASTILLILSWRISHKLSIVMLPFYVLLCCATVYIQAHYFVDTIAGFVTAILFFILFDRIGKSGANKRPNRTSRN